MTLLSSPDHALHLLFLGGSEVRLNGHSITGLSYNKMRALLAYLAVERERDHKREMLADLLWSASNPTTARGNLRRTLADLRRVLELPSGPLMFSASKHTIRFIPNSYIDVIDFAGQAPAEPANGATAQHHDERIIALYRGEFLAGLSLPDCPDFESWLQVQRETLHRRALALLEQLSNRAESISDYHKALEFSLRYCELEPWDEDACRRVMRLYAFNGQERAAISQYEACCRLLKNELGVLPSEETRQLAERIRHGDLKRNMFDSVPIPPQPNMAQLPAQRRQVTVLYCELIPASIDDPEEVMTLLHAPQARCAAIIRQFSGHIVQTHGGGLLAYFGYPQAHEDAARRAVQAALAMTRESAHGIDICAGVHTGLIITGGDASMPDTSGRTTRIAIQLRHRTAQYKVAISQETHSIVGGYFDCIRQEVQHLPGAAPVLGIFKVIRESGALTRLEAATQLPPFAGRKAEISRLTGWWEEVVQGMGLVVLIQGDAGIGKSRLLHTLKERLAEQPHTIRELRCFPEFSQSPFQPLIAMLEAIFGFQHSDTPELRFNHLAQYLEAHFPSLAPDTIPLFTQLLSLPLGSHYQPLCFSPQKQKELTIATVLAILKKLAIQQPVLLILEDLHWVDPSTLELLTGFVAQAGERRILAVLTARPDFSPPWKDALNSTLTLGPLVEEEVEELIASLRNDISDATTRRIVERADGVPLFVEEMAKIASSNNQAGIPATLQDLLAARMDSMGESKYAAQLAATLGREFNLHVLSKISPDDFVTLTQHLNALQDAGLILKMSESIYQFKHALIQEAAYQSQTKPFRQTAHQSIARALISDFPNVALTQPELLARHFSSGGEIRQAVIYWIKAGQRAALSSANTEATEHFNAGLQLVSVLSLSVERDQLEFTLCVNLGATLCATEGYGSAGAAHAYNRARELGEALDDRDGLFTAMWGMWLGSSSRIGHAHALDLAEKLLQLAQQGEDSLQLQKAYYAMGNSLLWTGQLSEARCHQEQGMAGYQASHHATMVSELGENIYISTGSQLAWVLWLQGFPDQARAVGARTLAVARDLQHPYSLCYASAHVMNLNRWLRQIETTRQLAEETIMLANQHGFPLWLLSGLVFQGWSQVMQGDAKVIPQLQLGVDTVRAAMSGVEAFFLAPLGEAHLQLGQWEASLSVLDAALTVVHAKDDHFWESEILRLRGECLLRMVAPNMAAAETCFSQARVISQRQGAKSLELRATLSMARLWLQQGKNKDAQRVLQDTYAWFAEGMDTPDLRDATDMLDSLRGTRHSVC